jgi:hypothetical protein
MDSSGTRIFRPVKAVEGLRRRRTGRYVEHAISKTLADIAHNTPCEFTRRRPPIGIVIISTVHNSTEAAVDIISMEAA